MKTLIICLIAVLLIYIWKYTIDNKSSNDELGKQ